MNLSVDSKFYADRFINKIVSRVEQLIEFPESGRIIPEKKKTIWGIDRRKLQDILSSSKKQCDNS